MVGFVRYPKSPRHVELGSRPRPLGAGPGPGLRVALVVDADDAAIAEAVAALDPDLLQLHGAETPERVAAIRARFGRPVMKAVGIAEAADLAVSMPTARVADRLLLDAKPPPRRRAARRQWAAFDWRLLVGLDPGLSFMLSGASTPTTWRRRSRSRARRRSTCRRGWRPGRASRTRPRSRPSSGPPGRPRAGPT